ncbi:MAG: hypothetical protein HRT73_03805 [Flavobacteriales bacterium]|nr:hypothetical protein [Flavobacteriales bacterium]
MKKLFIILSVLIVAAGCGDSNKISKKELETLDWMIEITQIELPPNTKRLDYYPYIEYGKLFKFQLDSSSMINFINEHKLKPTTTLNNCLVLINEVEEGWYEKVLENLPSNDYYLLKDCKPHYTWNIMARKSTGELWYEILYADNGGNEPDCDKSKIDTTNVPPPKVLQENTSRHYKPDNSEIKNFKFSKDMLFNNWAHSSDDEEPAFKMDAKGFHVITRDGGYTIPYLVKDDTIEVFEYHGGPNGMETSQGVITKLTNDSLIISFFTGGDNVERYVNFKEED